MRCFKLQEICNQICEHFCLSPIKVQFSDCISLNFRGLYFCELIGIANWTNRFKNSKKIQIDTLLHELSHHLHMQQMRKRNISIETENMHGKQFRQCFQEIRNFYKP